MLELDLLLLPFFNEFFCSLQEREQQAFIRLLEQDDPDLLYWFSRKGQSEDAELQLMVDRILKGAQVI
tara:strand:+ start:437 stop:640 length:204 start_codon:yes stop_codon:yes gene_type:complete